MPPRGQTFNYYINWAVYAIVGKTGQADEMMKQYGTQIRQVARYMHKKRPVSVRTLYRGVLLEPEEIADGVIQQQPEVTFVSFSESFEVACWFADPNSEVSGAVLQMRPGVEGWIMEYRPRKADILFHWNWTHVPIPGGPEIPLVTAARMHPDIDQFQFEHNLRTQREVVVEPLRVGVPVTAYDASDCPPTEDLDARLLPPHVMRVRD